MRRRIFVSDITIRKAGNKGRNSLTFREKIELSKQLDKLGVSVIETAPIENGRTDSLLVKSLCSAVNEAVIAIPVNILEPASVAEAWEAIRDAAKPRLQVPVPVSTVQMEYFCHRKPAAIMQLTSEAVAACAALCPDVEFIAQDFGRSETEFLDSVIAAAVKAGATTVTVSERAGDLFPDEFAARVSRLRSVIPAGVRLGVYCANDLHLADACAVAAIAAGADEIKAVPCGEETVSLANLAGILEARKESLGIECGIKSTELQHAVSQIRRMCEDNRAKSPALADPVPTDADAMRLTGHDNMGEVLKMVAKLGYELGEEDCNKVYDKFTELASQGGEVSARELDAIVASVAFQVPPTYKLESFVINSGNEITSTCHIRIRKGEELLESVCLGDGPVDAAFLAIEKVVGRHYELDDFQVRSVTEGREAMGEAVVRLREDGKVYSGRGISTDIIASSIMAYMSAVNKIAYEEA